MKQTAEEFLIEYEKIYPGMYSPSLLTSKMRLKDFAIKFAKLHVEAALKVAAETNYPSTKANFELVNSRILNAYPLENIK